MQNVELVACLLLAALTGGLLWLAGRELGAVRHAFLLLPAICLAQAATWIPPNTFQEELKREIPTIERAQYVGSNECRGCHTSFHDSWQATYHRSMTQLPSQSTVHAPFDGRVLDSAGVSCTVHHEGDVFYVDMPDPDWEAASFPEGISRYESQQAPRIRAPVVMLTGSHHLQAYWVPSQHGNKLRLFPYVYHIDQQRWIPNNDSFINPPDAGRYPQVWNNNCLLCHSVAGEVGYEQGNWQSSVAELGIACEACHGPGEAHVKRHRNPLTRYGQHVSNTADGTIVNPARLPHDKASEVCGQCHTAFDPLVPSPTNTYRPGADFHSIFAMASQEDDSYWPDGTMRIGGREFSGMSHSACYLKGELSCLSCHSMHSSDPNKQMLPSMLNNEACTQCHQNVADDVTAHTHHPPQSAGSLCYNCHMPYSSFALFSAIRSHRIDSPTVAMSASHGRPNACNQCHIDKTLAWTNEYLEQWYGMPQVELTLEQATVPTTVLWLLSGDAIQRVLAAWSLSWGPAQEAAGSDWQSPLLAQLLDDPYSMVRYMAAHSLSRLDVDTSNFDYVQPPGERQLLAEKYTRPVTADMGSLSNAVRRLFGENNELNPAVIQPLLKQRDDRPMTLNE